MVADPDVNGRGQTGQETAVPAGSRIMTTDPDDGVYAATNPHGIYTRRSDHARYDAQAINSVLDEAIIAHVGYVDEGEPFVVPVIHTRVDQTLYLHTSAGSRLSQLAADGTVLCVTVSLLEGLVLARSQVGHNVNYRSVVVRGEGVLLTDEGEKRDGLTAVVEHLVAGRSRHSRPPTDEELAGLELVRMPLDDVALKSRTGPAVDDEADLSLHHWAGVLGVRTVYGPAFPSPDLPYDRPVPSQLTNYSRSARPQGYR
jgi:nitroimidazol reductase NimA-like FMN-containing flavoprotein (pyridoxamine 5'-phosphate oxidase superfamily)